MTRVSTAIGHRIAENDALSRELAKTTVAWQPESAAPGGTGQTEATDLKRKTGRF